MLYTTKQPRGTKRKPRTSTHRVPHEQRPLQQRRGPGKRSQELRCQPCYVCSHCALPPVAAVQFESGDCCCFGPLYSLVLRRTGLLSECTRGPSSWGPPAQLGWRSRRFEGVACDAGSELFDVSSCCLDMHARWLPFACAGFAAGLHQPSSRSDHQQPAQQCLRHPVFRVVFALVIVAPRFAADCGRRRCVVQALSGLIGLTVHPSHFGPTAGCTAGVLQAYN